MLIKYLLIYKRNMKILVPSSVIPNKKSVRTLYISELIKSLKEITDLDFFWFLYQPDRVKAVNLPDSHILDIHDFNNAVDCLTQIRPDCVMIGPRYEPVQYALSLACKKLNIPLVSFYYFGYEFDQSESISKHDKIISYSRNILSSGVPTDSEEQKFFLRRLRFILFKMRFLKRTKELINKRSSFIQDLFSYFNHAFGSKEFPINQFPDLHLLPDVSWIEPLKKIGVKEEKLCVTGSPYWDKLYQNSKNYNPKQQTDGKISILIITDALVEHGLWNASKFTSFITNLINELSKRSEFSFSFKIHPASENKAKYQNLFQKLGNNSAIYQKENIWDIIEKFDLILTFGFSTIHSELSLLGAKTILLDFDFNFPLFPFVKEGLKFGNVIRCDKINDLNNMIVDFNKKSDFTNKSFVTIRDTFLYKFDGKSGMRAGDAIIKIINNKTI